MSETNLGRYNKRPVLRVQKAEVGDIEAIEREKNGS